MVGCLDCGDEWRGSSPWAGGTADMVPLLQGTDGGDHAFW